MLFTGQEYCKILNKNPRCITCCLSAYFADLRRFQRVITEISKVSVQTASNTPWMQGKAFLLRIVQYSCPVKSIVNYPIQTLIFSP